jgi:DNA-binding phage protein|tara:strand:- start:3440 stop:3727 length:288 start_codon:yes stop_codon:yes gene_type:complete
MQINKKFFPEVMQDNEIAYFAHLEGVISSVDELSILEVTKNPSSYHFRLAASLPKYNNMLLEEILKLHNLFKIRLDLSKSIKSSATIVFEINLDS